MRNEMNLSGVPSMTISEMVDIFSMAYSKLILSNRPIKEMPALMLWGPPGVGKSQGVRQIAAAIEKQTTKRVSITDVRLLLFNPIDLRGIPTANADKTLAVWLKPQIFQMDESEEVINILFLDEISAAPPSVQAAAYQITLDRVIGEHCLPDNCIVIAAGNRVTDRSVAYKMPKALANRLLHIEVDSSFDSWKEWAVKNNIHPSVVGFLSFRNESFMNFNASSEELAYATPRSWEMVSNILNQICDDVDKAFVMIAGLVGSGNAAEFRSWNKVFKELPSIEDIFQGRCYEVPEAPDKLYALISVMARYAREHKDDLVLIRNSIVYANQMPVDFSVILMKDYIAIEKDYKKKLLMIPEFSRWMQSKGSLLNGSFI